MLLRFVNPSDITGVFCVGCFQWVLGVYCQVQYIF